MGILPPGARILTTLQGGTPVAWSPDGRHLVANRGLWDTASGQLLAILKAGDVYSVVWSPDGKPLVSSPDGDWRTVRLWDATRGKLLATLKGHTDTVLAVAWSPDGRRLASASNDGTVRLWDAARGKLLATLSRDDPNRKSIDAGDLISTAVAWSPDGRRLASSFSNQTDVWWLGEG